MSMTFFVLLFGTNSTDCPEVINLAIGLNIPAQRSSLMTQLLLDCCGASGVHCNPRSRVDSISWQYGLTGYINGSALPKTLLKLDLGGNDITGTIPAVLPPILQELRLNHVLLTGPLPSILPTTLIKIVIDAGYYTGDVPIFPSSLKSLRLGLFSYPNNKFSGSVVLNQPNDLYLNYNLITDIIIADTSQLSASNCDISNNPLLGNPNIVTLSMCKQNNLYSPSLLPLTKSSMGIRMGATTMPISVVSTSILESIILPKYHWSNASIATTAVEQPIAIYRMFKFDWKMGIRLVLNLLILLIVIKKTPFRREFRKMFKKDHTSTSRDVLLMF